MKKKEFLEERRQALRDSIKYFESSNIAERDRWTCEELLTNLGVEFSAEEIQRPSDDPPDVVFRDARFEMKEITDPGRRRHDEFKAALVHAEAASHPRELLKPYTPKDIDPAAVAALVQERIAELEHKYEPQFRATLDLVLYVNLVEHTLTVGPMPLPADFAGCGWRSASAVFGWGGLVFHTAEDAPEFLRSRVGTLTQRKFA